MSNGFEEVLRDEVVDQETGNGSVNLELLAEDGSGDAQDFGDFVGELLVSLLIEEDFIVELVLDLDLGP